MKPDKNWHYYGKRMDLVVMCPRCGGGTPAAGEASPFGPMSLPVPPQGWNVIPTADGDEAWGCGPCSERWEAERAAAAKRFSRRET